MAYLSIGMDPFQDLHQLNICDWSTQQGTPKVVYSVSEDEFMIVWWTDHPSVPGYISGRRLKASDGTFPPQAVISQLAIQPKSE